MDGFNNKGAGRKGFGKKGSGFKKSGGRGSSNFGKRGSGGFGGRSNRTTMCEATCDKCGEKCSVPFKPTGGKPVYCSKCYETEGGSSRSGGGKSYTNDFAKINDKLDKIMKALNLE